MPVDNVYGSPVLVDHIAAQGYENPIVVSPDVGGVVRARAIARQLEDLDLAIIDKRRPQANETRVMNVIGDVKGKTCILVDDIVGHRRHPLHRRRGFEGRGCPERGGLHQPMRCCPVLRLIASMPPPLTRWW